MVIGITQDAYRVDKANHILYNGLSAATLTLTGSLPSVSFRCAVTLSSTTGHTDCAGSVVVGSETLTFTVAGKKITTTLLSALPVITTANLNCNILVEAINAGGAPLQIETATAIKCRFQNSQKAFLDPAGAWTQSQAIADTTDSTLTIGDEFRFNSVDYQVSQISSFTDLAGTETYRRLWLK